ncbi:TetR/AcrR family transcriptional regulator [Streptomyces sp. NPDC048430]|uniref:TetR/AcrR family transcriptional regulator n=1 Tax=Streptomyces sp. NPDC048430 TaxID=3155388 RepID=UPI0034373535
MTGQSQKVRLPYGEGRQALVEAAIRLVAREGLAKLTYRSLTAEAGVSQGSLRHHFPNLVSVLEAALEHCQEISHVRLRKPDDSLENLFVHLVDSLREHPEIPVFQTEVFLSARTRPELRELARRHQVAYEAAVHAALEASAVPPDEELAAAIFAMAEGIVYQRTVFGASHAEVTERQVAGSRRILAALQASHVETSDDPQV